jgi:EAL domain-containing protein (putative c-di-GMP-specific phosphodiesterase class I)
MSSASRAASTARRIPARWRKAAEEALNAGYIRHHFQPIWDLTDGQLIGFEALARFPGGEPPDLVFQAAADMGRGRELDVLSVRHALCEARELPGYLFVNLHPNHILPTRSSSQGSIGPSITRHRHREALIIEIMEVPERNRTEALAGVERIRRLGVRLALDDAGVRASDAERLHWLQPAVVKLDRSLLQRASAGDTATVDEWTREAARLGAAVVAEGVEDAELVGWLRSIGVTWGQGYALGRPEPVDTWRAALMDHALAGRLSRALNVFTPPAFDRWGPPAPPLTPREVGDLLYQDLPLPIVVVDQSGLIQAMNRAGEAHWGHLAAEVTGQSLSVLGLRPADGETPTIPPGSSLTSGRRPFLVRQPDGGWVPVLLWTLSVETRARAYTVVVGPSGW